MASDGRKSGSHEDSDGLTPYESGYVRGKKQAERRLQSQVDFLLKEREEFVEKIRDLEGEVAHLRRTTSDTGAIAP